jgi:hypothetical protein
MYIQSVDSYGEIAGGDEGNYSASSFGYITRTGRGFQRSVIVKMDN